MLLLLVLSRPNDTTTLPPPSLLLLLHVLVAGIMYCGLLEILGCPNQVRINTTTIAVAPVHQHTYHLMSEEYAHWLLGLAAYTRFQCLVHLSVCNVVRCDAMYEISIDRQSNSLPLAGVTYALHIAVEYVPWHPLRPTP
jgi:hypothetical protein